MRQDASPPGRIRRWLSDYWSRALLTAAVVAVAAGASVVALTVPMPQHVPDFALYATPVYRAEVGAACFLILYAVIQAIGLAASGRGFVRFGPRGVEPGRVLRKHRRRSRRRRR